MNSGFIINSSSTNPYSNLGLEEYLLNLCRIHQIPILYLWQNMNTVVIGRNQNLFTECNVQYLHEKNILPARRLTGGGAVYHDLGNLNYTIITDRKHYSVEFNTEIIINALKKCGLDVFPNGRNDICTGDGKISGNAYYSDECVGLQHGTILYRADVDTMAEVLSVPAEKLSKRGIKSVRSRVSDVVSQNVDIDIPDIKKAIIESFLKKFDVSDYGEDTLIEDNGYDQLIKKYSSKEWIEGAIKEYSFSRKTYCSWGGLELSLAFNGEAVSEIEISTDCMELPFVDGIRGELRRCINNQHGRFFPKISADSGILKSYEDRVLDVETLLREMLFVNGITYADI